MTKNVNPALKAFAETVATELSHEDMEAVAGGGCSGCTPQGYKECIDENGAITWLKCTADEIGDT